MCTSFVFTPLIASRCTEHIIHLAASSFCRALGIPSQQSVNRRLHGTVNTDDDGENDDGDDDDIDTTIEIEATPDDIDAIAAANVTDFDPGDVVGKLLALIAQVRQCSETSEKYLLKCCIDNGGCEYELKLWVRTRWGSLAHCFARALEQRQVCVDSLE